MGQKKGVGVKSGKQKNIVSLLIRLTISPVVGSTRWRQIREERMPRPMLNMTWKHWLRRTHCRQSTTTKRLSNSMGKVQSGDGKEYAERE